MSNSLIKSEQFLIGQIKYIALILLPSLLGLATGFSMMRGLEKYFGLVVFGITSFAIAALTVAFCRMYLFSVVTHYVGKNYSHMESDKTKKANDILNLTNTANDEYLKIIWLRWNKYGRLSLSIWLVSYIAVWILAMLNIITFSNFYSLH